MTFGQRVTPFSPNSAPGIPASGAIKANVPVIASALAQERARSIASAVSFLRENGYPIGRVILVSDQGEAKSTATGRHLQVALPDTPVIQFGIERLKRLPLRSVDMVVVESSVSSGEDLDRVLDALKTPIGGVFRGIFEGNRSAELVEVGKPVGRLIAPKTSSGLSR